jgi:hypothetical protein
MADALWFAGVAVLVVFVNIPQQVVMVKFQSKLEGFRLMIPEIKDIFGIG